MDENKVAQFWETERELRRLLLPIGAQLELTQQVLRAQLPKVQALFGQLTQLGEELGLHVDRRGLEQLFDYLESSGLFHAQDLFPNDVGSEGGQQEL